MIHRPVCALPELIFFFLTFRADKGDDGFSLPDTGELGYLRSGRPTKRVVRRKSKAKKSVDTLKSLLP